MIEIKNNHEMYLTYNAQGRLEVGDVFGMVDGETVGVCEEGASFVGVVATLRDGKAGVLVHGVVPLRFASEAPELGWEYLCGDGNGNVMLGGNVRYRVVRVDDETSTVWIIL